MVSDPDYDYFQKPAILACYLRKERSVGSQESVKSKKLQITFILIESALQPRVDGLDAGHVQELQAVAENWPPLVVVERGGQFVLVDGFHRLAAAQNLGLDSVPVTILPMPEDGDLHALAFALNAIHGRPLTLSDRREFAVRLLRQHSELSDREIGRRSGLTQPPIAKLRSELEARQEIAPTENRIGGDGQVYKVQPQPPRRAAGELPTEESESLVNRLLSSDERRAQRQISQYLQRLAVAFEDQDRFEHWRDATDAAEAVRAVLSADQVSELAENLGIYAVNVLDVAELLGYVADTESQA